MYVGNALADRHNSAGRQHMGAMLGFDVCDKHMLPAPADGLGALQRLPPQQDFHPPVRSGPRWKKMVRAVDGWTLAHTVRSHSHARDVA